MRDKHVVLFTTLFIVLLTAIPVFSTTNLSQSGYQLEDRIIPQEEIASTLAECLEAPEGIVAWWPGDWDGADIVGGNNLEDPSSVTYRNGFVDGAFYFDGSDEVLTAPGTGLAELQTLTIELWVCHVSLPSSIQRYVTLPVEKAVIRHAGNGILHFYMNFGTADNWELHHVSAPGLTAGEYHHVAGTYDGSYMRLYLDGVEVASEAVTGVVYSDETEVQLGSDGEAMWGLIDEVSIYDRALTPLELQAISDAGSDGKCKPKDIAVIPTSRDFGVVEVGDSASEIVTVRNVGDEPLSVTDASFEPYSCSDFAVTMYSNVVNDPYVGWGIGSGIGGSIYQSFTANAIGMIAVSLTLIAGGSFPETGYTTTVRIRSETTDGSILGTASAFVPGPMTGGHQTEVLFKFSETLPTVFGNTYVIEWVYPESQAILNWMAAHYDSYPGGNYFGPLHIPVEYIDAYFAVFVSDPKVDQINDEELDGSLGRVYGYPGSVFQSFVPSEPCLGGVVLGLVAGGTFPGAGLTNEIRIRDGSFDGAILGTATQFISGPRGTGESIYVHYSFIEPLTLTPGQTYVIEWMSPYEGGTYLSWLYANDNPYPNGLALLNDGTPIPDKDLIFATYDSAFTLPKRLYSDQILKIVVEFTPSSTGKCFGTLAIQSDDLDEAVVDVEFVGGEDIINSNWRVFPVTLDGMISTPEEWAYAQPHMLQLTRSGGWGTPDYFSEPSDETMTVRFMNDGQWLYILYQVPWRGPLSPPDSAGISMWEFIGLGLVSSDASYVGSTSTYDAHGWNGAYWTADTDVGGENNVEGTSTFDGEYYWFEFRKPLDSGDGFDWSLNPGDRIGDRISPNSGTTLELSVWDPDTGSLYGHWAILQLSKGLVSWWPGDKNPFDIVGPNPGSMNFDASFAPGMVGDAFAFDGQDDYIRAASTGIGELQQLTIETWVKITELAPNPQRFVTLKGEKAVLRHDGGCSLHQLHFYMNFGGPPWLGEADMHHIRVDNVLYENEWYHVAGTYDGSVMRLYLNGELVGSHDVVGTTFNLDWLELSYQGETLNGLLDEVSIYGYALSEAVIKSIYDAGSAGKPKPTNDVLCPYPISVTSDIELTHNVLCDGDGIIAAKNFIVLDGDGHSLLGSSGGTGIYANWYHGVTINDFVIQDFETGIFLDECGGFSVTSNYIADNYVGLSFKGNCTLVTDNVIIDNTIGIQVLEQEQIWSGYTIIQHAWGYWNSIYLNYIINNAEQVQDAGINLWYDPVNLLGNYWSCYIGMDLDGDGVGDTDIPWPGPGLDLYPLVMDDFDNDGLSYYTELVIGTDPLNPDSDFDGYSDGDEWRVHFTDPLVPGPFFIDGDDELAAMAAWHEWDGDGSEDLPYIIENYEIDVNDADVSCIEIQNILDTYFIIRDCTLTGSTGPNYNSMDDIVRAGIHLYNVHGAELTNNLCFGNVEGICLNMSTNCLVNDNECYDNEYDGIIVCILSYQNDLINNYCHDNGWDGIIVAWGAEENTISSNDCFLNGRSGITLVGWYGVYGGASNNHILDNNCTGNDDWGIAVRAWSNDNVVEDNFCKNNEYGFFVVLSSYNIFFHNEIVNNVVQAQDIYSEFGNHWYHPELLEGNIWSDYIGVDFDRDGIGDTDVPWPGEGYDLYPLVTDDFDNDGLSYYAELVIGTDPENPDSDFDNFNDGDEWRFYFTDPLTYNSPQEVSEVVDTTIQDLVDDGDLELNNAIPLQDKISEVIDQLDKGKPKKALQTLYKFLDQIDSMIKTDKISEEDGNHLKNLVQGIIDAILAM